MLRSGNDAAVAIAEHISGSSEEFVVLMNAEAKALGATGSHFVTPNGLHDEEHYSTVYDMYLFMNAAVKNEPMPEGVTVIGGKTGTTGEAKYCLVQYNENTAKEPVISIVLKADSRDNMYLLMSEMLKNFAN